VTLLLDAEPAPAPEALPDPPIDDRINLASSIPFLLLHLTPLLLLWTGISGTAVALLFATFWGRMFFITAGYHRYFAHRSYRLARVPQFLMAFGGITAAQKGPLWWAAHHRDHHRSSDTEADIHTPQKGFWWSHVGWILCDRYSDTKLDRIQDFARFPELRFLNKHNAIGPWSLAIVCFLIGGWSGLVLGFLVSTVLLWHSTFFINSLAHVFGRRRYATTDTSRNSALLAVLTMGEGWHNNHHYYQSSCRNGFFWWEWDPTFYVLTALSWVGIVRDMKKPPERLLRINRVRDGSFDIGMFRASWAKAARAVAASRIHLPHLHASRAAEGGHGLHERRASLEHFVHSSLESAEALAEASRRAQRVAVRGTT
jgi:stearoyl-CoA desaturase (delta-9 desaturase)